MTAYHMYSDEEKISRFRRVEMKLQYRRSEHQGTSVSEEFDVGRAFFATAPQGDHVPLHATSRRQILVVLDGEYQFTSTTGEVMRLEKGDLLFADDAEGIGHLTDQLGEVGRILLVTIPPALDLGVLVASPQESDTH